jgi:hypothetical protein
VPAQHHRRVVQEIRVAGECRLAALGRHGFGQILPARPARCLAGAAFAQEQEIDDDVGAGGGAQRRFGQAHRRQQVGDLGQMPAGGAVAFVHGPAAGDERGDPARAQELQATGDEPVVQRQTQASRRIWAAHRPVGEGWIADGEIEAWCERGTGEVFLADTGGREKEPGDPRGDRLGLDPGKAGVGCQLLGDQGEEEAGAAAGLQGAAASEAEVQEGRPDHPDDGLRCVVGVLGRPGERGQLRGGDQLLELQAQLRPARPEVLVLPAEQMVGELAGAEAGEPGEDHLLLGRGRPAGLLDLLQQPDRGQVVGRTGLPAWRQGALAGEPPADRRRHGRLGRGRRFRLGHKRQGRAAAKAQGVGRGGVEKAERELLVAGMGHRGVPFPHGWSETPSDLAAWPRGQRRAASARGGPETSAAARPPSPLPPGPGRGTSSLLGR